MRSNVIQFPDAIENKIRLQARHIELSADKRLSDFSKIVAIERHPGETDDSLRQRVKDFYLNNNGVQPTIA